jgi:hypothetical protein
MLMFANIPSASHLHCHSILTFSFFPTLSRVLILPGTVTGVNTLSHFYSSTTLQAFKKVAGAFTCLSDASKKSTYDRFGKDTTTGAGGMQTTTQARPFTAAGTFACGSSRLC